MAKRKVTVQILGDDKQLRNTLNNANKSISSFGVAGGIAIAAVGAKVVSFAEDSVKAFAEAEESQLKLQDAFARFPKLGDRSYKSMVKYNQALAKKTRFDDDAIASAQGLLAKFDLTGKQLEDITPLVLDYAAATGKTAEEAAGLLGKAMMGNTKALKTLGIDYKLTGDDAKDFAAIQKLVSDKVGGFAEKEGKTAAGQLDILRNQFGELKETVGEYLTPALSTLVKFVNDKLVPALGWLFDKVSEKVKPVFEKLGDVFRDEVQPRLEDFGDWLQDHKDDIENIAKALGVAAGAILAIVAAVKTMNTVMSIITLFANPWLLALAAIGLVAAAIAYLSIEGPKGIDKLKTAFETAFTWLKDEGWPMFKAALSALIDRLLAWWKDPNGGGKFRAGLAHAVQTALNWLQQNAGPLGAKIGYFLTSAFLAGSQWVSKNPDKIVKGMAIVLGTMGIVLMQLSNNLFMFFVNLAWGSIKAFKDKLVELIKGFGSWLLEQFTIHVDWGGMLKGAGRRAASGFWDSFKSAVGSLFGGFSMPSLPGFGGGRAGGGPVSMGRAYVVGEAGPELFVPRSSGMIVPNDMSNLGPDGGIASLRRGAVGGGMTVNVYLPAAPYLGDQRTVTAWINDAVRTAAARGYRPALA